MYAKFQAANLKNGHFRAGPRRKIPQLPVCLIRIDTSCAVWRKADQRFFVNHFGSGYAIHFKSFSLTAPTGAI